MTQYIDKAVIVAEIERRISAYQANFNKADNKIAKLSTDGRIQGLKSFLSFLNTLEVKEVEHKKSDDIKTLAHMWADTYRDEASYKIAYNSFLEGAKCVKNNNERITNG